MPGRAMFEQQVVERDGLHRHGHALAARLVGVPGSYVRNPGEFRLPRGHEIHRPARDGMHALVRDDAAAVGAQRLLVGRTWLGQDAVPAHHLLEVPGVAEGLAIGGAELHEIAAPTPVVDPERPQVLEQLGPAVARARHGEAHEGPQVLPVLLALADVVEHALHHLAALAGGQFAERGQQKQSGVRHGRDDSRPGRLCNAWAGALSREKALGPRAPRSAAPAVRDPRPVDSIRRRDGGTTRACAETWSLRPKSPSLRRADGKD